MLLYLTDLIKQAEIEIKQSKNISELELIKTKYLGNKSDITKKIKTLNSLPLQERSKIGVVINQIKRKILKKIEEYKNILIQEMIKQDIKKNTIDISIVGRRMKNGRLHPISQTIMCIEHIFNKWGFSKVASPEIEDDYHNFDALNISIYHPTRNNHDTFWFDTHRLLRTQTSNVQIHIMKKYKPPIKIITSGRVYRHDYDHSHTPMFHQTEGLIIDRKISFIHLKEMMFNFLRFFFKKDIKIRFRPSYFPFTKLSAEIDILDSNNRWLEILGCGMVHPNILNNFNINSKIYSGLAFGIGIERLTMLRYNINDLRMFFENDLRFLNQFN